MYSFEDGNWKAGCGCGGQAKAIEYPPVDSTALIFNVQMPQFVIGNVTGSRYLVKPNMIAIDIKAEDALGFVQTVATIPQQVHYKDFAGYRARTIR